jgi:hypothetical protein
MLLKLQHVSRLGYHWGCTEIQVLLELFLTMDKKYDR